ncbi:MAG TPA: hypothetical protein VMF89_29515 [Polyangiales bacterium]|nr:hypothetical protein [Polyangiales bacterium]
MRVAPSVPLSAADTSADEPPRAAAEAPAAAADARAWRLGAGVPAADGRLSAADAPPRWAAGVPADAPGAATIALFCCGTASD